MDSLNQCGTKLRIWQIAETYPPEYGGGAAIGIQELCRLLAGRGHEIRVLCVENADREPYTIRTDYDGLVRVDRVNLPYFKTQDPDGWQLGIRRWRKHQQRIVDLIEEQLADWKPDLVEYHTSRPFGEELLVTIRRNNIPLVAMFHEAWLSCAQLMLLQSPMSNACPGPSPLRCLGCVYSYYDGSWMRATVKLPWRVLKLGAYPAYRLWRRRVARQCVDAATGISNFMVETFKPHINGPVKYTPYPFQIEGLPATAVSRPRTPLRFGFVAGFQPNKGIWDVLDAAASLKRSGLAFEIHIWGPNQEAGVEAIVSRELTDRIFLRGMYAAKDLVQVYEEVDVAIMATKVCEPLGRVPIEAAAVGAPTIAPAVGGITETICDGVDGLLYRFRDAKDLERQMRRILVEPGLIGRLIKNLPQVLNAKTGSVDIEEFYFTVLGRNPKKNGIAAAEDSNLADPDGTRQQVSVSV